MKAVANTHEPREVQIIDLVRDSLRRGTPGSPAILAPGLDPISYEDLLKQVEHTSFALSRLGFGRDKKIALVAPNGPQSATAFLGIADFAVVAPLNPAYRKDEFDFYLSDLSASALVISSELDSAAREVARARSIPVIELVPNHGGSGLFTLQGEAAGNKTGVESSPESGSCLVLHTSGTTARPKIVPLSQANLCASARNIARTLKLTSDDRCLNVMPLFHIHGLVAATLATIASGGSVICSPGPRFPDFFTWLRELRPTWYTAVPTVHQAILMNAARAPELLRDSSRLRFVRSSSSALPPKVMEELGRVFQSPVIEAYGMTEASHQIASNPLPPGHQKPGSVGIAAGPEVAILDDSGACLGPGKSGEVVIRGPTVTAGYEGNPEANQRAFTGDSAAWFRTGDLGYLDADGYLFLVGRIKEIINRGGEKISPREIDEVLLNHRGVLQATAFAMPHPTLGEEIVAAVVPKDGQRVDERELTDFVRSRVADFKVPKRIILVDEIPKGPTGKIQRTTLFEKFRERISSEQTLPQSPLQEKIAKIWQEILGTEKIGIHDSFFSLGGDSLQALTVIAKAREAGILIDPILSLKSPTVAGLAAIAKPSTQDRSAAAGPLSATGESWWQKLIKSL